MNCPYCYGKIGMFSKYNPCPHCQKELKTKTDFVAFFIIVLPLAVVFALVKNLFAVTGSFQHILMGVVVAFTLIPTLKLVPKDPSVTLEQQAPSRVLLWKPVLLGVLLIILMGFGYAVVKQVQGKTIQVVVPADMSNETVQELLADPDVQQLINEDEK